MPSGLERALRFWNKNKRNILKCLSSKYINGGGIRQGKGIWKYKIKKNKRGQSDSPGSGNASNRMIT